MPENSLKIGKNYLAEYTESRNLRVNIFDSQSLPGSILRCKLEGLKQLNKIILRLAMLLERVNNKNFKVFFKCISKIFVFSFYWCFFLLVL